jgi:hypothetical protein
MAYQPTYGVPAKRPLSKWWPIGVIIAAVIFFAIGGGILGAYYNSFNTGCTSYDDYSYNDYCYSYGNIGLWDGGIACLCLGGVLKLTFWILFIIYRTQRRRYRAYEAAPSAYVNVSPTKPEASTSYAPPHRQPQYSPAPTADPLLPQPYEHTIMDQQSTRRFCGQCGTAISTTFCTQCGAAV